VQKTESSSGHRLRHPIGEAAPDGPNVWRKKLGIVLRCGADARAVDRSKCTKWWTAGTPKNEPLGGGKIATSMPENTQGTEAPLTTF
jgi:hypothetical protein